MGTAKYLPPILQQIEEYRADAERCAVLSEPMREVTADLAKSLRLPLDGLKTLIRSGVIPAAKVGRRGGLYVTTAALERWKRERVAE